VEAPARKGKGKGKRKRKRMETDKVIKKVLVRHQALAVALAAANSGQRARPVPNRKRREATKDARTPLLKRDSAEALAAEAAAWRQMRPQPLSTGAAAAAAALCAGPDGSGAAAVPAGHHEKRNEETEEETETEREKDGAAAKAPAAKPKRMIQRQRTFAGEPDDGPDGDKEADWQREAALAAHPCQPAQPHAAPVPTEAAPVPAASEQRAATLGAERVRHATALDPRIISLKSGVPSRPAPSPRHQHQRHQHQHPQSSEVQGGPGDGTGGDGTGGGGSPRSPAVKPSPRAATAGARVRRTASDGAPITEATEKATEKDRAALAKEAIFPLLPVKPPPAMKPSRKRLRAKAKYTTSTLLCVHAHAGEYQPVWCGPGGRW
jgi:hypothetical protein